MAHSALCGKNCKINFKNSVFAASRHNLLAGSDQIAAYCPYLLKNKIRNKVKIRP